MPIASHAALSDRFGRRLAACYAAVFAIIGIQMPFFPVWLEAKGLTARQIAFVLAAPMLARLVAVPLAARLADRFALLPRVLSIASLAAASGFVALGGTHGFAAILLTYAASAMVLAPILPLLDAYALAVLVPRGRAYGPVRLWGSAAFIGANLVTGWALGVIPATATIWLIVAALLLAGAFAMRLPPLERQCPERPPKGSASLWLPGRRFMLVALAASLIQASHALYYSFSVIDWTRQGLQSSFIGVLWATGVLAEIGLFAASPRLPAIRPLALIGLGGVGACLRWALMASQPSWPVLLILQGLHGLSFGATFLGSVQIAARLGSPQQLATTQGDLATLAAALMAIATAASGPLYGTWGSQAYLAMVSLAAAGTALVLVGRRYAEMELLTPRPGALPPRIGRAHGSPSPSDQ